MSAPAYASFFTGTSNIELPVPNKAAFPEAFRNSSRLTYYASLYNSLEVNSSFYKIPLAKTVARWTQEVPEDFRFTFKLFRDITHTKTGDIDVELVHRFMQTINAAKAKAGALLIQFPASVTHNPVFLERLLTPVSREAEHWDICVEFRHASWYRESVGRLLDRFNAAIVMHDKTGVMPAIGDITTDFTYLRFHGPNGDYRGSYEFDFLERQTSIINELLQAGKKVYAYFNNTMGTAVFDALALQELVTGEAKFQP